MLHQPIGSNLMPTDRYTKAVLTVIACALVVLTVQNATGTASAQQSLLNCTVSSPCYVTNTGIQPLSVTTSQSAAQGSGTVHGIPRHSGQFK